MQEFGLTRPEPEKYIQSVVPEFLFEVNFLLMTLESKAALEYIEKMTLQGMEKTSKTCC